MPGTGNPGPGIKKKCTMKPVISIDTNCISIVTDQFELNLAFTNPVVHQSVEKEIEITEKDDAHEIIVSQSRRCPHCGNTFTPANPRQKYCSKTCSKTLSNKKYRAKQAKPDHPLKGKPAKTGIKTCQICKKQYHPNSNTQRFCSV